MNAVKKVKVFTRNSNTNYFYAYKVMITQNFNDYTL